MEKRKRTLYVLPTNYQTIWFMWNVQPNVQWMGKKLFVQCDMAGKVNWDKNSIYTKEDLENKYHKIIS